MQDIPSHLSKKMRKARGFLPQKPVLSHISVTLKMAMTCKYHEISRFILAYYYHTLERKIVEENQANLSCGPEVVVGSILCIYRFDWSRLPDQPYQSFLDFRRCSGLLPEGSTPKERALKKMVAIGAAARGRFSFC